MLLICIVTAIFTTGVAFAASRRPWSVDAGVMAPNGRPMPRTGGVAVAAVWIAASLWAGSTAWAVFGLGLAALVLGLHDDLTDSDPKVRLGVMAALALAGSFLVGGIDTVALWPGSRFGTGFLAVPLGAFVILATHVGFDFVDGLDGHAAGLASMAALGLGVLGWDPAAMVLAAALAGFLRLNTPPAQVYLGDAGSNLCGLLVGLWLVQHARLEDGAFALVPALLIVAVPAVDTVAALVRRVRSGAGLFTGDTDHIHQALERKVGTKRATSGLLTAGAIGVGIGCLVIVG